MNLWIRSQDKERLTEVNDLRIYYGKEEDLWAIEDCDDLGYYKTKERALEVLDEIQNKINSQYLLKPKKTMEIPIIESAKNYYEELNNINIITCDDNFEIKPINANIMVYEMPKE